MGSARRALIGVALLLAPTVVAAHTFENPKHDHVSIDGDVLTVRVSYAIQPGEMASQTRKIFDRDASGELDAEESEACAGYLRQQALYFLEVELNGKGLELKEERHEIKGLELPVSSGLEIVSEWVLSAQGLALKKGRNSLVLQDRYKDQNVAVPVLVRIPGVTTQKVLDRRHPKVKLHFQAP